MNRSALVVPILAAAFAAAVTAQEMRFAPPEPDVAAPSAGAGATHPLAASGASVTPIHTAADDGGLAYGVWGAGARYKASFHDGPTFVPLLGRDYPATQSLRWHTLSARVGGVEYAIAAPRLWWGGCRAQYDHGGVIEAYDVRPEGLEQTFTFRERPAGGGDLVVRGEVATGLAGVAEPARHGDVVFADDAGNPIAGYGAATAVDARGERLPMETSCDGGVITLRLAAAAVAEAVFPLVVDPLIGNLYWTTGSQVADTDVLRDTTLNTGNVWFAEQRWASATDSDAWLWRIDDDGSSYVAAYSDVTTSWSTMEPSVGLSHSAGKVLLTLTREFANPLTRFLRFHSHSRNNFTLSTSFTAIGTGGYNAWRTDVATDLNPVAPQSLLVVFQREGNTTFYNGTTSEVYGTVIDLAAGTAGTAFAIAGAPFEDFERPCVGKLQLGGAAQWTVAYQVIGNNPAFSTHDDWDVQLRRVDRAGNVSAATDQSIARVGDHQLAPQLAGYNDHQVLVWTASAVADVGARPAGDNGQYIAVRHYTWNGTAFVGASFAWGFSTNIDPRNVLCGFDVDRDTMSHYLVTYRSNVTENVYWRVFGYDGAPVSFGTVYNAGAGETTVPGSVAYDDDHDRFLLSYGVNGATGSARVDGFAQPVAPAPTLSGLGCSAVAPQWVGSQLVGETGAVVRMTGLPSGALSTMIVGTQTYSSLLSGVPLVHPGCWLLVPNTGAGSIGTLPFAFGPTVEYPMSLPSWLSPMTLYFQGVHFDAGTTEVFTTQRLAVPIVE